MSLTPHPDRLALNLAHRARLLEQGVGDDVMQPGPGSADARMDLKILANKTRHGLRERWTAEAEARLAGLSSTDLWAGTIQDGTARGFRVALEEALSLCALPKAQGKNPPELEGLDTEVIEGRELQRRRDILVASAGPRIRFRPRKGILFVDRKRGIHEENCVWFDDRSDTGCLDGFVPKEEERPRLFSSGFLKPERLVQGPVLDELVLAGRLGPARHGYPCRLTIRARKDQHHVQLVVAVDNQHEDHRLRIRFLGFQDPAYFGDPEFPPWELVSHRGRTFLAATLVRACGRLRVDDTHVAVPEAQCPGWITHEFRMGADAR